MDPFSLMLGVAGLGLQLFGTAEKAKGASQANQAQQQQVQLEQQQEAVRMKFMETDARRKNLQILRTQQQAQALAYNNASTSGAMFGSGLQGGLGQISGQSNTNAQGVDLGLMQGRQMFALNSQISQTKLGQLAGQQTSSEGAGMQSLGGTLIGAMKPLHQLTGFNTANG